MLVIYPLEVTNYTPQWRGTVTWTTPSGGMMYRHIILYTTSSTEPRYQVYQQVADLFAFRVCTVTAEDLTDGLMRFYGAKHVHRD